jgi:hypothetical protein
MDICVGTAASIWFEFQALSGKRSWSRQKEGANAIRKATMFINKLEKRTDTGIVKKDAAPIFGSLHELRPHRGGKQPCPVAGDCMIQLRQTWIPGVSFDIAAREYHGYR